MENITNTRKAVCIMANALRKNGYTLSQAFRKAWRRIKQGMTFRAAGVTFNRGQEKLQFLANYKPEDIRITLEPEPDNHYDLNAIRIVAHITPIKRYTTIGYIPKALSGELSRVVNKGVNITAAFLGVIGGYSYKETYGALLSVSI